MAALGEAPTTASPGEPVVLLMPAMAAYVEVDALASLIDSDFAPIAIDIGRAALSPNLSLNMSSIDQALEAMAGEVELLGGELVTWFEELNVTPWATAAVLVAGGIAGRAIGRGGAAKRRRRNRRRIVAAAVHQAAWPDGRTEHRCIGRSAGPLERRRSLSRRAGVQALRAVLRMVVRRRLSAGLAKFDSSDIVQSVWADLVDGLRRRAVDLSRSGSTTCLPGQDDAQPLHRSPASESRRA